MPSLRERVPQPLPRQGQLERLATARRLTEPVYFAPDPAHPYLMRNDRPTSDSDLGLPSDDADSPQGARSALSAPENFIAESPVKKLFHRHFGRKRWPVVLAGIVITGAAAAYVGLNAPTLFPPNAVPATETARGTADRSVRPEPPSVAVTNAQAHSSDAAPAPRQHQEPAAEPAPPATGPNFQQRLAAAGLPNDDANAIGTTEARVTAFPPNAAVEPEPEPPSTVPPPAEPPPAERQDSAAIEASPAKASPQPNPKLDALVARAEQLLAAGDVLKARQFFGRIAADGDSRGAWGMARSYDEQILRKLPVVGLTANPAQAKWWYEKAEGLEAVEQPDRSGRTSAAR